MENTPEIIKSSHQPSTVKPFPKPYPLSASLLNASRNGDYATSLGSLFQCLTTLSVKSFLLISILNLS